ncbi:MAG: oligosaccharide flippase family protein [Prevotella sp.]|nr:oligosaccharide flippase family protein [Prevotella sp.]
MGAFERLGKNTALIMVGNVSSKILSLLMLPLYTFWLSTEDFGTTDIITVYTTLLIGVVSCCITDAIFVIPKGQDNTHLKKYFTSGLYFLFVSSIVVAFVFWLAHWLFLYYNINNSFSGNLLYIYCILITGVISSYMQQFCRAIDKIAIYSIVGIVSSISIALFSVLLIPIYGVYGFVCATILSNIVNVIYITVAAKIYRYVNLGMYDWSKLKELLFYSIPLIPNSLMWWFANAANKPILEHYCGLSSVGLLAVASKFPGFLNILLTAFNSSWIISVIEEYPKKEFKEFFNKGLQFFMFILTVCASLICIFSDVITLLFTGNADYYESWVYMAMLALSTMFSCVSGLVGAVFSAVKKSKYYFYSSIWGAGTSIIFNLLLIRYFSLWGAVIATTLSMAVMMISRIFYSRQYVEFTCYRKLLIDLMFFCTLYVLKLTIPGMIGIAITFALLCGYFFLHKQYISKAKQMITSLGIRIVY